MMRTASFTNAFTQSGQSLIAAILADDVAAVCHLLGRVSSSSTPANYSRYLLVAARHGKFEPMRALLQVGSYVPGHGTALIDFAMGREWDQFEVLAKNVPAIASALQEYRARLDQDHRMDLYGDSYAPPRPRSPAPGVRL